MYLRSELFFDTLHRYLYTHSLSGAISCGPRFETEVVLTYDLITLTFDLSVFEWGHGSSVLWTSCQCSACYALPLST